MNRPNRLMAEAFKAYFEPEKILAICESLFGNDRVDTAKLASLVFAEIYPPIERYPEGLPIGWKEMGKMFRKAVIKVSREQGWDRPITMLELLDDTAITTNWCRACAGDYE